MLALRNIGNIVIQILGINTWVLLLELGNWYVVYRLRNEYTLFL